METFQTVYYHLCTIPFKLNCLYLGGFLSTVLNCIFWAGITKKQEAEKHASQTETMDISALLPDCSESGS